MELYRYRSYKTNEKGINYDKEGLINSEIYFAELSELNDPMEGYIDVYFQGDLVIWKNLLKNYFLSLYESFTLSLISRPIPADPRDLFEPIVVIHQWFSEHFQNLCNQDWFHTLPSKFISDLTVSSLLKNLPNKHISKDQLLICLKVINIIAIKITLEHMANTAIFKEKPVQIIPNEFLSKINWRDLLSENENISNEAYIRLNQCFNSLSLFNEEVDIRTKFILIDFPNIFMKQLEKFMYPEFYVACFSRTPKNSSMWGNYANLHQGICLKFNFQNKIPLYLPYSYGSNGVSKKFIDYTVNKVNYSNCLTSLNFFENLGNVAGGVLDRLWLIDNETKEATQVKLIDDTTREKYWQNIYDILSQKTTDWEYEQEERLLLNNMFGDFYESKDRCVKYDFNCLEGIIFGLRTSDADKKEIIDIIANKCRQENRENFTFYQSFYNKKTCNIDYQEDIISNSIVKSILHSK